MVRRGVTPRPRELDEGVDRRWHRDHLRLGGASSPHGDHDDPTRPSDQPGELPRDSRLPHSLAGADDRDRRELERQSLGRIERKSAPTYGRP